jgi:hypothetical protein
MDAGAGGMTTRFTLQRDPGRGEPRVRLRPDEAEREGAGRVLACAICAAEITTDAARMAVSGAHEHTFANPHGIVFRLGCFAAGTGLVAVGAPSAYFTWFPGHTWQAEHCASCGGHLGWLFRGADTAFHGLILDRLAEATSDPH